MSAKESALTLRVARIRTQVRWIRRIGLRTGLPALASGLALALGLMACAEDSGRGRVLLIGIDAATLRVIRPMLQEGRLPNLAEIARDGISGPLRSHMPLLSPRIWTSIATGKMPHRHGIKGFARKSRGKGKQLFLSSDRRGPALWNIASEAGFSVAVINWWTTYPVEKINGVMVSDHLLAANVEGQLAVTGAGTVMDAPTVWPPEWQPRIESLRTRPRRLTAVTNPFDARRLLPVGTSRERLARYYEDDETITRIALEVERELRPDLLMVFLPGIDRVSHFLWGAIEPPSKYPEWQRMSEEVRASSAEALRSYYAFTDALIGRLVAGYGPRDLVMVVSDHGFEPGQKFRDLTGVHESAKAVNGVIFARGPRIRPPPKGKGKGMWKTSVNDVTPTILAWLNLPAAKNMDGRVAAFIAGPRLPRVVRYNTPIERLHDTPSGSENVIFNQLRALGYLEQEEAN